MVNILCSLEQYGEKTMNSDECRRDGLLDQVVVLELNMFQAVREKRPSLCRDQPEAFRVMRRMTHSVLSNETLTSYLADLERAADAGENLMTAKYARMNGLVPCLNDDPVIDDIVRIEREWQKELTVNYPELFTAQSAAEFERYLRSELDALSPRTLGLIFDDMVQGKEEHRNLAEERYDFLARMLGYHSIRKMERAFQVSTSRTESDAGVGRAAHSGDRTEPVQQIQ
jgi:hypothetical protein